MSFDTRHKSRVILDGVDRAGARSMMKAIGFSDRDLSKPQIGVAHCWIGTMPCNFNWKPHPLGANEWLFEELPPKPVAGDMTTPCEGAPRRRG